MAINIDFKQNERRKIIETFEGNVVTLRFTIVDDEDNAIDLTFTTGESITLRYKDHKTDTTFVDEIEGSVVNATDGIVDFDLGGTGMVDAGDYVADLLLVNDSDTITLGVFTLRILSDLG